VRVRSLVREALDAVAQRFSPTPCRAALGGAIMLIMLGAASPPAAVAQLSDVKGS